MNAWWLRWLPDIMLGMLNGRLQLQKTVSNTGWLIAEKILRMAVGLVVNAWIVRYLGPEKFGALNYAFAFAALFTVLASLGLDTIVVRNLVRDPGNRPAILGSCFALKTAGGVVASLLTVAAILLAKSADHQICLLVGITAIGTLFQAFGTFDLFFQAEVKSKFSVYARSSINLLCSLAKLVLVSIQAPLVAFALLGSIEIVLGSVALLLVYRYHSRQHAPWQINRREIADLLHDTWPLLLSEFLMLIYLKFDRILIGEIRGNAELGIYSVAALLAESLLFFPLALSSSLFPGMVEAKAEGEQLFHATVQRCYNLIILSGYAVAVPVTLLAGWIVTLLFGEAYRSAATMLVGLVWGGLFFNIGVVRNAYLTVLNKTRVILAIDFLGCLLNIALNFYLIPRFGGMGAVVSSIAAYWFVAHGSCYAFRSLTRNGNMIARALVFPKIG